MKTATKFKALLVVMSVLLASTANVHAAFIGDLDGVTSSSTFGGSTNTSSPLYGWTAVSGGPIRAYTNVLPDPATGMIHLNNATANYTAQFDTGVALEADTIYDLSVRVGNWTNSTFGLEYGIWFGYLDESNTWFELADKAGSFTATGEISPSANGFNDSLLYQTGGTLPVDAETIAVRVARTGGGRWGGFDTVTLQAVPVPEPGGMALALGGILLLCGGALRHRRQMQ
jgi:hypothetical protein